MGTFTITQSSPNKEKLYLYPNSDSSYTDWNNSTDGVLYNYQCVNEAKLDTSSYVTTNSVSYATDLYELENHTDEDGTINYVKEYAVVKADFISNANLNFYLLNSPDSVCTDYSNEKALTNNWRKLSHVWSENPSTSSAWTWGEVDNMSGGVCGKSSTQEDSLVYEILRPDGDGDIVEFDGHPNNTAGQKYTNIDEVTVDHDDYIYWTTDSLDSADAIFTVNNPTSILAGKVIKSVKIVAYMKRNAGGSALLEFLLKTHGTLYTGGIRVLHSSWNAHYSTTFYNNPNTGTTWTLDEINALQAGIRGGLMANTEVWCPQIYVIVRYYETDAPALYLAQFYAEVGYTSPSRSAVLNKPEGISIDHDRNVKMLNFWNGEREVYDVKRTSKTTVMRGMEYYNTSCTSPGDRISTIKDCAKNGATITVSGLDMYCYNGDYKIRSFGWKLISNCPETYEWILELEDEALL